MLASVPVMPLPDVVGDSTADVRGRRPAVRPPARPGRRDLAVAAAAVIAGQVVVWAGLIGDQPRHGTLVENAVLSALWLAALAWRRTAPVAAVVWAAAVFCFLQPIRPHDLPVW